MKTKYRLSFADQRDLKRIRKLFAHHAGIMRVLNEDSRRSVKGGAVMSYEVTILLEEKWS